MFAVFILQCFVFIVLALNSETQNTHVNGQENQLHKEAIESGELISPNTQDRLKRETRVGRKKTKKRKNGGRKIRNKGKNGKYVKNRNIVKNKRRKSKTQNRNKKRKNRKSQKVKHKKKTRNKRKLKKTKPADGKPRLLTGDNCQWLDFDTARSRGGNCDDGTKMVIKNKKGVRKQFLLTNGKTIYGFVKKGEKFADCSSFTEITDSVDCKSVEGLSGVSLSGSTRAVGQPSGRVFVGKGCEWIDISKVRTSGQDCADGSKFVIAGEKGTRKQFLLVDGRDIIAFVKNKEKFANCAAFTEVTDQVDCKTVSGVGDIILTGANTSSPVPSPAPSPPTSTGLIQEIDFEPSDDSRIIMDPVPASDHHQVTVTAKFWHVSDFQGDAESLADTYAEEMNLALARSNIPITYMKWGSVQMLPLTHADIETEGSTWISRLRNFVNAFGDSEEGRRKLKQSADHIVVMVNNMRVPYSCFIFGYWDGYQEDFATMSVSFDMTGVFVHEAGHCLGAMHDRVTMEEPDDPSYNYGYCLPDSPYSTIMAYSSNCPPPRRNRILHFSNPAVTYEGIPTGDAENNNARAIMERRDRTSKYGSNCYDGYPDEEGHMENRCRLTAWSDWSDWSECCCVEREDLRTCPTVPYTGDNCVGCVSYLWKQQKRSKTRSCLNALNEVTHASSCEDDDGNGGNIFERRRCDCSLIPAVATTATSSPPTATGLPGSTSTTTTSPPTTSGLPESTSTTTASPPTTHPSQSTATSTTSESPASNHIQSPGYPQTYSNNLNMEEIVTVEEGKVILFKWIDFELESHSSCAYDHVSVVEYMQEAEMVIIPKSCGSFPLFPSFTSKTNKVIIRFITDGSVTRKGFLMEYESVDPEDHVVNTVSSPGYPGHYANNLDMEFPISVTPGKTVSMVFKYMNIEVHSTCKYDYVTVTDSNGTILLPKTCGGLTKLIQFTSLTHQVVVKFHTDSSVTATGFLIEWEES